MTENSDIQKTAATDDADHTADVVSDPAKDDTVGQDWSDEGGATPSGPATSDEAGG
jgi:hypothetical protein